MRRSEPLSSQVFPEVLFVCMHQCQAIAQCCGESCIVKTKLMISSAELISSVDLGAKEAKGYFMLARFFFMECCAVDVLCSWRHTCQGKLSHREHMQTPCAPPENGRQISFLTLKCNLEICIQHQRGEGGLVQRCARWVDR